MMYYVTMKYYEHEMIWDGMMCTKLLSYYEWLNTHWVSDGIIQTRQEPLWLKTAYPGIKWRWDVAKWCKLWGWEIG
jgi:hypothetical protein